MVSRITYLTIGANYPENIMMETVEQEGRFLFLVYLMKEEKIHRLLVSSPNSYDNKETAEEYCKKFCESCLDFELFGIKARKEDK
ncbi:hypothetical protein D3C87_1204220 [compost metagenome]